MSSKNHLLLATASVAFFIASCGSADNEPGSSNEDYSRKADSTSAYQPYTTDGNAITDQKQFEQPFLRTETEKDNQDVPFKTKADSIAKVLPTSSATLTYLDSTHMFIRTADVRCRVDEVADATYRVEDVVKDLGGYVSNTQLASTVTHQQQNQVSEDSLEKITHFEVSNTLTIRVPARNLDSLIRSLVPLVDHMDYRIVNVNDITLDQLAQELMQKRNAKYNAMLQDKIIDETSKPDKIMNAADAMLAKQIEADNAFLESLRLRDQVAYATLTLQLYQPETTEATIVPFEKYTPYDEGTWSRFGNAVAAGWKGLSYILAGIIMMWPLWLIGGLAFYFIRRYMRGLAKAS